MLVMVFVFSLWKYIDDSAAEMQELYVGHAANSASDAAVELALETAHIDMFGRVTIDPEIVWAEYRRTFLRALGIDGARNRNSVEAYFPAVVLAVNDGYFMRVRTMVERGGIEHVEYVWTQKIPYARTWTSPVSGDTYIVGDTMNGSYIHGVGPVDGAAQPMVWGSGEAVPCTTRSGRTIRDITYPIVPPDLEGLHDTAQIGSELVRAMNHMVEIENSILTGVPWAGNRFYVPRALVDEVYYDAVEFFGLSLMVLIQDFDMIGHRPVDYFTVSNTQIVVGEMYALMIDGNAPGGTGWYAPAEWYRVNEVSLGLPPVSQFALTQIQAAQSGFWPHHLWHAIK